MKRIITLLAVAFTANLSFGQTVFQSDLSSWDSTGNPTDWMGTRSNIGSSNVTQQTVGATYGTSMASLVNSSTSSHKRFTTQNVNVVGGSKYIIKMWVAGSQGDLRVNFYDNTSSSYGTYTSYQNVGTLSGGSLVLITDSVTVPSGSMSGQFILSLRNTSSTAGIGLIVDSVAIEGSVAPPPPPPSYAAKTIYQIQNTTLPSGDSPLKDSLVETTGIVTGVGSNGYFIQDGTTAWNGVYVYDNSNTPNRGDEITVKGKVIEYFNLTEVTNIDTMITVSTGNTLPAPISVTTSSIADEMYEGMLVKVSSAMCVDSNAGFGEWDIQNPTLDTLPVDDLLFRYTPVQYQGYDVTGIVHYSFGEYKLEPRDSTDIQQSLAVSLTEENNELNVSVFPNPVNDIFTLSGVELGTAEIFSAEGKLVQSFSLNYINTVNVSELEKGMYILRIVSDDKVGITRFVKQ